MNFKTLLLVGLIVAFQLPVKGQDWQANYESAQNFLSNGEVQKANEAALQCLADYQRSQGAANTTYASILRLLQNTSYGLGEFEKGLDYAFKEITIREAKSDTILAGAYQQAAQFLQQLDRYSEAIALLKISKEILLQYFKENEAPVVACNLILGANYYFNDDDAIAYSTLNDALNPLHPELKEESALGLLYFGMVNLDREKNAEAIKYILQARDLYTSLGMSESLENGLSLFNLGIAYHRAKKFNEAEKFYTQAQLLLEKLGATEEDLYLKVLNERSVNLQASGSMSLAQELLEKVKSHPGGGLAYAESLSNRASILQNQGSFQSSLLLYQDALKLFDPKSKEGLIGYAATLENMAVLYSEMNQIEKSTAAIQEALVDFDKALGANHPRLASAHSRKAQIAYRSLNYEQAKAEYEKALQIIGATNFALQKEKAIALNGLARCYQTSGNFQKSDSLFNQALKLFGPEETGDVNYLNTLNGMASSQQDQGNWQEARILISKAKNILKNDPSANPTLLANALESTALINLRLGYTTEAKSQLDSALSLVDKDKESIEYGLINLSIGKYHLTVGEYTKAEVAYRNANETILNLRGAHHILYAQAQNSFGLLYQTMGNFTAAEPLFQNALLIYESNFGKRNGEYTTVLQNLATLYQLEEKYDKADVYFTEVLETDRKILGESHPHYAISLQNLATLYQKTGRAKEALPLLENVLKIIEETTGKNNSSYATAVSNLAAIHQDNKNFEAAEKFWKESVEIRKRVLGESHPDYARSLYGMAALYHATGKFTMAKPFYETVVVNYQKQIKDFFPALSEKEKSAFYNKIRPAFDAYQDFCVEMIFKEPSTSQSMIESLYNLQLGTKAILLNASNKVRTRILNGDNQELKGMYNNWLSNKEAMVKLLNLSADERKQKQSEILALEQETNSIEKKLSEKSTLFSGALEKQDYTWKDVHNALKPTEAAVEILRIKKKFVKDSILYVGLVLTAEATSPSMIVWQFGTKMENRFFRYHRNTIKHQQIDTISYRIYWKPLADKLSATNVLYLSCDGIFNKINPSTILNPSDKKWVLDTKTIRVVSNTRELAEKQPVSGNIKKVSRIFGFPDYNLHHPDAESGRTRSVSKYYGFEDGDIPPLPATEQEAMVIGQILNSSNWNVSSFTKSDATEDNFKTLDSPGILHVATHGFFLSDLEVNDALDGDDTESLSKNPLFRSGLLLAGVSAKRESPALEDGILTAYEAMNLSLDQTELVALSACETGLGEVRNGEGVYGLQRAFSVAGAKAVLMSLWQVDDKATQELMTDFYSIWLKGTDKFSAFRQAQINLKAKYPQPYYWGAFVLSGH